MESIFLRYTMRFGNCSIFTAYNGYAYFNRIKLMKTVTTSISCDEMYLTTCVLY